MLSPITITYPIRPCVRSVATGQISDLFGLTGDEPPVVVCENLALDILPGDLVLFSGPSGSGKSSILREAGRQLNALDADTLILPDRPLIDALDGPIETRLERLSLAGLGEARLMLRRPAELSEGQRERFRLAYALSQKSPFVLLDEFTARLDRPLAKVVAFNLRKLVRRNGTGVLAATTQTDIIDDLNPDVLVSCDAMVSAERFDVKKKRSPDSIVSGCRTAPSAIGRISLGGITAGIRSRSSAA